MNPAAAFILGFIMSFAAPAVLAQGTAAGADDIRTQLLRPGGWIYEWKPVDTSPVDPNLRGETGAGEMVFEAKGDALRLKINNLTLRMTCERDVTLSGDTVVFNACLEPDIRLRHDAADPAFPFKGAGPRHEFRLKPR